MRVEITHPSSIAESPAIHLLPCQIDHDGPANVSTFFAVSEIPTSSGKRKREGKDTEGEVQELSGI